MVSARQLRMQNGKFRSRLGKIPVLTLSPKMHIIYTEHKDSQTDAQQEEPSPKTHALALDSQGRREVVL